MCYSKIHQVDNPGGGDPRTCDLQALWRKGNPDKDHTTTRALVYNSAWLAISLDISIAYVVNLVHLLCQHWYPSFKRLIAAHVVSIHYLLGKVRALQWHINEAYSSSSFFCPPSRCITSQQVKKDQVS